MPERRVYSDAEVEAAIQGLSDPERLEEAQRLVAQNAPRLQHILHLALEQAEWFGSAHQAEVLKAAGIADPDERLTAMRTLVEEETRVSLLIGVAVGLELGHVLSESNEGKD